MSRPTPKSPVIEALLTAMCGISRQEASEKHICTVCRGDVSEFHDELSLKEYEISGMCQKCQDAIFHE